MRVESTNQAASKSGLNLECSPLFMDASANVSHGGVGGAPAAAGESDHRGHRVGRSNRCLCRRGSSSSHGDGVLVGILCEEVDRREGEGRERVREMEADEVRRERVRNFIRV